jgi:hypothetical protein
VQALNDLGSDRDVLADVSQYQGRSVHELAGAQAALAEQGGNPQVAQNWMKVGAIPGRDLKVAFDGLSSSHMPHLDRDGRIAAPPTRTPGP